MKSRSRGPRNWQIISTRLFAMEFGVDLLVNKKRSSLNRQTKTRRMLGTLAGALAKENGRNTGKMVAMLAKWSELLKKSL